MLSTKTYCFVDHDYMTFIPVCFLKIDGQQILVYTTIDNTLRKILYNKKKTTNIYFHYSIFLNYLLFNSPFFLVDI